MEPETTSAPEEQAPEPVVETPLNLSSEEFGDWLIQWHEEHNNT